MGVEKSSRESPGGRKDSGTAVTSHNSLSNKMLEILVFILVQDGCTERLRVRIPLVMPRLLLLLLCAGHFVAGAQEISVAHSRLADFLQFNTQ